MDKRTSTEIINHAFMAGARDETIDKTYAASGPQVEKRVGEIMDELVEAGVIHIDFVSLRR